MSVLKKIIYPFLLIFACKEVKTNPDKNIKSTMEFYSLKIKTIEGKELDLNSFKGKKLLIVNVASECGYTPQYKQLQELYDLKKNAGFEIIGVPANNFGGQEPGTETEIKSFCERNYGVTFTLTEKVSVVGKDQHQFYQWLSTKDKNGWNDQEPTWNFCKYLIDENGNLIKFFSASVSPLSDEILNELD